MAVEMSCAELGRRVLRVGLERLAHLPYREYGRQLRWSILTWLCRELVKILGGDDQWDGFPTKGPIDAIAEFAAVKREAGYKWSYFVVYLVWLTRTVGPERAYCTWQTLEKRYLKDLPSILELAIRPVRRRFKTSPVLVFHKNDQWQADLVEKQPLKQWNGGN